MQSQCVRMSLGGDIDNVKRHCEFCVHRNSEYSVQCEVIRVEVEDKMPCQGFRIQCQVKYTMNGLEISLRGMQKM